MTFSSIAIIFEMRTYRPRDIIIFLRLTVRRDLKESGCRMSDQAMKRLFAGVILTVLCVAGCSPSSPSTSAEPVFQPQITAPAPTVVVQCSLPTYTIDDIQWTQNGEYGSGRDLDLTYSFTVHNNTTNQLSM
jgi:hypothetical protein